ncbi:59_t:CDS:2 [Paraglomus occultum]|uniref:59_t:CDS:1 n=1 Tax=Paraglomus occultum TaxID=144539 RepID=A0A9N9C461_9GLOM|nr:59_t:CDS:2 [Paraglomus occultum]
MFKKPEKRAPISDSLKRAICAFHNANVLYTHVEIAAHFNAMYNDLNIDQTTRGC